MQNLFGFISHPMELGLIWVAHAVNSAGIGIILFTIFVRLILAPLQITQLRNAKKMQKLQPLIKELQQKHGKDREKLGQATMALYKEHNANPALGCLPTLIQFPILIGLFYGLLHLGQTPAFGPHGVFVAAKSSCNGNHPQTFTSWLHLCYAVSGSSVPVHKTYDLFHASFLWLSNGLGRPDPLYILPLLAGLTQWIQSRMMLTQSSDPQQQMMNSMMNFMPLLIIVFALRYASGLPLYWVTSTLIGIAIQARITGWGLLPRPSTLFARGSSGTAGRPPRRPSSPAGGNGKTPRPPKPEPRAEAPEANDAEPEDGQSQAAQAAGKNGAAQTKPGGARAVRRRSNRAKGGGKTGGRRG